MATMPDFGGRLSPSDSELLIQYLTAPYLRIPLLIAFFRDAARIHALDSPDLQGVLDAALFEPGEWQAYPSKSLPDSIPSADRHLVSTPVGMLLNEMAMSPKPLMSSVEAMLDLALDLDTGSFQGPSTAIILFVIRLSARVEGHAAFAIRHAQWMRGNALLGGLVTGCGPHAPVRGLAVRDEELAILTSYHTRLCEKLRGRAYGMLEGWRTRLITDDDITSASICHAHMGYVYSHALGEAGMHWKAVETLLSCQIYLTHNYGFTLEAPLDRGEQIKAEKAQEKKNAKDKMKKRGKAATPFADGSLGFSQLEVFDVFQKHRRDMLSWIESGGSKEKSAGEVLESTIRVLTSKGRLGKAGSGDAMGCARVWGSLPFQGCVGRLCPDTEVAGFKASVKAAGEGGRSFEEWMRITTTAAVETEINIQVGTFTLKSNQAEMLGEDFTSFSNDLADVFQLHAKRRMQCAKVAETEERRWVRVMGIRHDLQLWCSDKRPPSNPFSRPNLVGAPAWFNEGMLKLPPGLGAVMLEEFGGGDSPFLRAACVHDFTLKEIVVTRDPVVVHVFDVIEHGRRFFRTQVYSSDASFSLHQMPPVLVRDEGAGKRRSYRLASGNVFDGDWPAPSLVVSRNVCSDMGRQRYIPRRMLYGTIPDCLLEDYSFWQSEPEEEGGESKEETLRGYKTEAALARDSGVPLTMIVVDLVRKGAADKSGRCGASATAKIQRVSARMDGGGLTAAVLPNLDDPSSPPLLLLAASYAAKGTPVARIRDSFIKLEPLSHCLFWSRDGSTVSMVELPRLRLSFKARDAGGDGGVRFYCQEHSGLYLSSHCCANSARLMKGLPHGVLLQNTSKELFVLVSAAVKISHTCLQPELFPEAFLDHSDAEWLENVGDVRHYLYPVHVSRMFFTMPSLAASLYLLLHRFLDRQYAAVAQMAPSCVSDSGLSPEEQQLWESLELTVLDQHPDATACRLLISCATVASRHLMPCPWSDSKELAKYAQSRHLVSAACRLPLEDEDALSHANQASDAAVWYASVHVANRRALIEVVRSGGDCVPWHYPPCRSADQSFDTVFDRSCLDLGLASASNPAAQAAKLQGVALSNYQPPEEGMGSSQVRYLNKLIAQGLTLSGLTPSGILGLSQSVSAFLLCFELLGKKLDIKVLKEDDPHQLGNLLLRMLPTSELLSKGLLISILRSMCLNPGAASKLPSYQAELLAAREKAKMKQSTSTGKALGMMAKLTGAVKAAFDDTTFALDFISAVCRQIAADKSAAPSPGVFHRWHAEPLSLYSPPELVLIDQPTQPTKLVHGWHIPAVPDFSCEKRVFHPVSTRGVDFDAPSVSSLSFLPMSPLGLKDYVADMMACAPVSRPPQAVSPSDARADFGAKFAASTHPSSRTRNARSVHTRLHTPGSRRTPICARHVWRQPSSIQSSVAQSVCPPSPVASLC